MRRACLAAVLAFMVTVPAAPVDAAGPHDRELDALFEQLRAAQDVDEALTVEARIWKLWSDSGDARVNALLVQGIEAMESGALERAVTLFSEVVSQAPGFAEGWNKRATAYYLMRDPGASVADIQRTLALEPRHFGAVSGMGLIFLERGDLVGALSAFERVLEIHPRSLSAQMHVMRIRERLRGRAA